MSRERHRRWPLARPDDARALVRDLDQPESPVEGDRLDARESSPADVAIRMPRVRPFSATRPGTRALLGLLAGLAVGLVLGVVIAMAFGTGPIPTIAAIAGGAGVIGAVSALYSRLPTSREISALHSEP